MNCYEHLFHCIPEAMLYCDCSGCILSVNPAAASLLGVSGPDTIGLSVTSLFVSGADSVRIALSDSLKADGAIALTAIASRCDAGAHKSLEVRVSPVKGPEGIAVGYLLRLRERLLRDDYLDIFVKSAPAGVAMLDRDLRYLAYSRRWLADYGLGDRDIMGLRHYDVFPEIPERWKEIHRHSLTGVSQHCEEDVFVRADGTVQYLRWDIQPWFTAEGSVGGLVFLTEDITERVEATRALRESEGRFRALIDDLDFGVVLQDKDDRILVSNRAAHEILGFTVDDLGVITSRDPRLQLIQDDGSEMPLDQVPSVMAARTRQPVSNVFVGVKNVGTGERKWLRVTAIPRLDEHGGLVHVLVSLIDVTEKRVAEQALLQSQDSLRRLNERFSIAAESARIGVWELDLRSTELLWDKAMYDMYSICPGEFDSTFQGWHQRVHPEDLSRIMSLAVEAVSDKRLYDTEFRVIMPGGEVRHIRSFGRLVRDASGIPERLIGISYDITKQKQLEEQLVQSQKMQAIGQLAGGVAHDFNNMLTVITGYSDALLSRSAHTSMSWRRSIEQIRDAGERAALLTRQLLLFSRQAQLKSEVIDVNKSIQAMSVMLARMIEEHVRLDIRLASAPSWVNADRVQIEQAVMNLCLNARDAMTRGGRLGISTDLVSLDQDTLSAHTDCHPGEYVRISVSDTGCGMTAEVMERIFEPFYTTKEVGKGTGLGLATVYAVVKQCGGFVTVASTPGSGSLFSLHLPAAAGPAHASEEVEELIFPLPGRETILLVEDEQQVRDMLRESLETFGYRVIEASDGVAALQVLEGLTESIDLLVTDVVMPHMGGAQLVQAIRRMLPNLPVLFMSGYSGDALNEYGGSAASEHFLQKPFTPTSLAAAIRELLEQCLPPL